MVHLGFHVGCLVSVGRNCDCYVAVHWTALNSDVEIEKADGIGLGSTAVTRGFVEVENPRVNG
jgi:hypothetical protein